MTWYGWWWDMCGGDMGYDQIMWRRLALGFTLCSEKRISDCRCMSMAFIQIAWLLNRLQESQGKPKTAWNAVQKESSVITWNYILFLQVSLVVCDVLTCVYVCVLPFYGITSEITNWKGYLLSSLNVESYEISSFPSTASQKYHQLCTNWKNWSTSLQMTIRYVCTSTASRPFPSWFIFTLLLR